MKIFIDKNLTPRAPIGEWPQMSYKPGSMNLPTEEDYDKRLSEFNKALAQAKLDSVELTGVRGNEVYSPGQADTFIEVYSEIEFFTKELGVITFTPHYTSQAGALWVEWKGGRANIHRSDIFARIKPVSEKVETLSAEVVTQIVNIAPLTMPGETGCRPMEHEHDCQCGAYGEGWIAGATHQHPIAFDAGNKEGWNDAINTAHSLICRHTLTMADLYEALDKLKK